MPRYRDPNARRTVHKRMRYKCGECDYERVDHWIYHQIHYESCSRGIRFKFSEKSS